MATTTTAKNVKNYSDAQTANAIMQYNNGTSVENIATALGKTTRSIVAKLSREGVYKAKTYKTKSGTAVIAKETFVTLIADALNTTAEQLGGLEKANKATLELIYKALVEQVTPPANICQQVIVITLENIK